MMGSTISKLVQALGVGLFLLTISTPLVKLWLSPSGTSAENRDLAGLPARPQNLAQWQELPQEFSGYLDDNFGFRRQLLRLNNRLHLALGSSPSSKIILGRDGWLFFEIHQLTDQNRGALPLSERSLQRYLEGFREIRSYTQNKGIEFILLPVPDKHSVYPDYLPDWVKAVGPSRYQQLSEYLQAQGEPYVVSLPALLAARKSGERVYFQTDTHWSCQGAFVAYQALMDQVEALGLAGVHRVSPAEVVFHEQQPGPGKDMARSFLALDDLLLEHNGVSCELLQLRDIKSMGLKDGTVAARPYQTHFRDLHWRYTVQGQAPRSRALVYRDSYGQALIPYLLNTFDEVIVVPHPRMIFDGALLDKYKPDIVIYEFVERSLHLQPTLKKNEKK
jgi:alginate O-acetyltransferase complex protein AlgJ